MAVTITASLAELDLPPGCTVEVDTGNAAATVDELNVYTRSPPATPPAEFVAADPAFTYGEDVS